jgi:hypothetical protein
MRLWILQRINRFNLKKRNRPALGKKWVSVADCMKWQGCFVIGGRLAYHRDPSLRFLRSQGNFCIAVFDDAGIMVSVFDYCYDGDATGHVILDNISFGS